MIEGCEFPSMKAGTCYVDDSLKRLMDEPGEEIEVYTPTGHEYFVISADLEGNEMNIWECPDGRFRSQLCVLTGK